MLLKIGFFFLFCCVLLLGRLAYLQIARGETYTKMVQEQRLETIAVDEFERGNILDCHGRSLTNQLESCLVVFASVIKEQDKTKAFLQNFLQVAPEQAMVSAEELNHKLDSKETFIVSRGLTDEQTKQLQAQIKTEQLSGVFILSLHPRYARNPLAVHLLGFVGEANSEEAKQLEKAGLPADTMVGKSGIEKQYDVYLQGKASDRIGLMVDGQGNQLNQSLRYLEANKAAQTMGYQVKLTLDQDVQEITEEAMAEHSGAAVVIDVKSGDVRAMCSTPAYQQEQGQIAASEGDVYINKALSYYPPASVFKLVLVLAALDKDIACPDDFVCPGYITLSNGRQVACWDKKGHGVENLTTALGNSCNPYFIYLGQLIGGETIKEYTNRLGLTKQTLIGFSTQSLENNLDFNSKVEGDLANVSIGEKGIRLTPLLVAQLLATIANDGKMVTPRLVEGILDEEGNWLKAFVPAQEKQVVKSSSAKALQYILSQAVAAGTGTPVANTVVSTAGKSGTTQNAGVWFAGFAPIEAPQWAVAVYLEDGDSGGKDSGSVFREIVEQLAILYGIAE